jgi:hypothetical protein
MKKSEFKKKVAESPNFEILKSIPLSFTFNKIGGEKTFIGLASCYDFLIDQIENWGKHQNIDPEVSNIDFYIMAKDFLISQINNYFNNLFEPVQISAWSRRVFQDNFRNVSQLCSDYFTPECKIICAISEELGKEASSGAYRYFRGENSISNLNVKQFKGFLLAYENDLGMKSAIFSRTKKEIQGINEVNKKYSELVQELGEQHLNHLAEANTNLKSHIEDTFKFKEENETLYDEWFDITKNNHETFSKDASKKIANLEEIYEKKLQLQAPAKYWDKKSKEYLRQAILSRNILIAIIAIFGTFFASILVIAPDWIFKTVFEGNKISIIRWSVVFIALISLLIFIIKAITKVMFSAFHLARDAEERHTLTFFYLALLNDPKSQIKDEERKMIIQSLFSRVDTGLLKGDSTPEMPNDFLSKILGKG